MTKLSSHQKRQQDIFDSIGKGFSEVSSVEPWQKSYISRMRKRWVFGNEQRVLEIGFGSGFMLYDLKKNNPSLGVYGIDISNVNVERLKEVWSEGFGCDSDSDKLSQGIAENLPYPDEFFDYVIINAVIEHIEDEQRVLSEIHRVLKSSGRLMLTAPVKLKFVNPLFYVLNLVHDWRIGHLRRYDERSLTAICEEFGFNLEHVEYSGFFLKVSHALLKAVIKTSPFDDTWIEDHDANWSSNRFGSSNIISFLVKK